MCALNASQGVILHLGHEESCEIVYVDLIPRIWMYALNASQGVILHVGHEEVVRSSMSI